MSAAAARPTPLARTPATPGSAGAIRDGDPARPVADHGVHPRRRHQERRVSHPRFGRGASSRRPPLRHQVPVRRGREVDHHRHVHPQILRRRADEAADRAYTLLALDQHDRLRDAVLPRRQDGRVDNDPRDEPRAPARTRPLALHGEAVRAHRARRMAPAPAARAALEAKLARAGRRPVGHPVGASRPANELVGHVSRPGAAARPSAPCCRWSRARAARPAPG